MASGKRNFSGCITGMPSSSASILTGGGLRSRPRPEARSGWVTTPTTSYCPARAVRVGSANSGDPMKTTLVMGSLYQQGQGTLHSEVVSLPAGSIGDIWLLFELISCKMMKIKSQINSEELMENQPMDVTSDDKLWALLAYIFSPLVPIIILLMEDKKNRPFIRAHNMQALVVGVISLVF